MYTPPPRHLIGKFAVSPLSLAIALTFSLLGTNLTYAQTVPETFLESGKQAQILESEIKSKLPQFDSIEDHFGSVDFEPSYLQTISKPISTSVDYQGDVAFKATQYTNGIGKGDSEINVNVFNGSFTLSGNIPNSSYSNGLIVAKKSATSKISLVADSINLQDLGYVITASNVGKSSISLEALNDIYVESINPDPSAGQKATINASGDVSLKSKEGNIGIHSQVVGSALESLGGNLILNAKNIWVDSNQTGQKPSITSTGGGLISLVADEKIILKSKDTFQPLLSSGAGSSIEIKAKQINIDGSAAIDYAIYAREKVYINGSELTQIEGNLYANGGNISVNSNSDGLTFINGAIFSEDGTVDVNLNQNQNSRVMLIGVIDSYGSGNNSTIDVNFGRSGLFKGVSLLESGAINLSFKENSAWFVEGNSSTSSLNVENALIDFTAESDKDTVITTESLEANNAVLLMDVIATSNKVSNDSLKVQKSALGNAFVHVPSSGQGDGKTDSGALIETPTGQKISYALASPALSSDGTNTPVIDLGVYNYELKTEDRNGKTVTYLTPYVPKSDPIPDPDPTPTPNPEPNPGEPELSPSANAVLALAGSGMQTTQFLYSLSDLRKRMGEIRYGAEDGLYAGIRGGRDEISSFASTSFRNEYGAWSIGYDHRVNDEWIVGALFEAIEGDQRVKSHGYRADGEDSTQGFRAYATWFNNEGAYADFVVGLNRFDQDISTHMLDGHKVEGDFDGIGWGVSAEVGRQFLMGDDKTWFIEPQAQFAYFRVKGEDFSLDNGMTVDQDSTDSLTGRFGLVFGKTKVDNDGKGYQLTGKFGINHEFMGESDIKVNGVKFSYDSLGTRGYYGVGFNWYLSKHARVYGQVEREQGSRFTSEINARLGVKYHF